MQEDSLFIDKFIQIFLINLINYQHKACYVTNAENNINIITNVLTLKIGKFYQHTVNKYNRIIKRN
jgi:hypothetical protein